MNANLAWRRDRLPTITVRADLKGEAQGPDVTNAIDPALAQIRGSLSLGYRIEVGGAAENSVKGQQSIAAGVPLLVLVVVTLLMMQTQSFALMLMILLTAPLGLIGVTAALLAFRMPFGFVAMLGTIALSASAYVPGTPEKLHVAPADTLGAIVWIGSVPSEWL